MSDTRANPLGYADLKALAAELRRPLHALLALSDDNDPFLASRPGRRQESARWFAELWDRLEVPDGVHLRRLHYLLVSTTAITLPDGTAYVNTHRCWKFLGGASADARFLDLVPADAFVDRRAPEPIVYIPGDAAEDASIEVCCTEPSFPVGSDAPLLHYEPAQYSFPALPGPRFSTPKVAEPAIEIWVEKTTMNDVLLPLAQAQGVTLVTGVGELSITHCLALVRRVREHGRSTWIFYISDFDPAGAGMPTSVARKIEFFLRRDGDDDLDIRLVPLLLTAEQVAEYGLPRVPIKDSDRRKGAFEERYGSGAVELDALEALHPGELARIVAEAIDRACEPMRAAEREIARMAASIRREVAQAADSIVAEHADELTDLRAKFEQAQSEIEEHQDAITAALDECRRTIAEHEQAIAQRLEQWREDAAPIWEAIAGDLEDALPDLSEIEWPEPEEVAGDEALFDSARGYLEQIEHYNRRKNGGGATEGPR